MRVGRVVATWWLPALVLVVYAGLAWLVDSVFIDPYPDGDQALVADMTRWFSALVVREPFFFGQAYLFPLGSYLAVPLVWLGSDPFVANEIVTAACLLGPFLVVGTVLYARSNRLLAMVCWAVPLLFPSALLVAGLQPRGLVEPIGLAALLIALVGLGVFRSRWVITAVFAAIGFAFGSVPTGVVLAPFAVAALLVRGSRLRSAVLPLVGMGTGFIAVQGLALYYVLRPGSVVFPRNQFFSVSAEQLGINLANPVIQEALVRILVVLVVPVAALGLLIIVGAVRLRPMTRSSRIIAGLAAGGGAIALLAVLASTKLADSMASNYFSADRLLLGFAFLPLGYLIWFERAQTEHARSWRTFLVPAAAAILFTGLVIFAGYKGVAIGDTAGARIAATRPVPVAEKSVLAHTCGALKAAQRDGTYLFLEQTRADLIAYGCHAMLGVEVVQEHVDRRSWAPGLWERSGLRRATVQSAELTALGYTELPFGPAT